MLCPVTLQAQRCWNCFGAICCEKYSKHQVTEFPFTALFWGVAALSQQPGREVAGVLPPPLSRAIQPSGAPAPTCGK